MFVPVRVAYVKRVCFGAYATVPIKRVLYCIVSSVARGGGQSAMAPPFGVPINFFRPKLLFKNAKNRLAAGAAPRTLLV